MALGSATSPFKRTQAQVNALKYADPAYNPNANFTPQFGGESAPLPTGATGQMRVGGQGGTGQTQNTNVTAMTPNRGTVVNRIGGTGGTGMPVNKGMAPLERATFQDPFRGTNVMPVGGTGPGSALDKLPGYVEDYLREQEYNNSSDRTGARQRAMATPSGAPGIGGTGGVIDPRKAALNGYRDQ